jgi:required for meiotic nuclear division protein 1
MKKVIAFHIAESIDIKKFRKEFTDTENHLSSWDVFYANDKEQYLYLLAYGVVVFVGYDEQKMSEMIEYLKPLCKNLLTEKMREEFIINTTTNKDAFEYNEVHISKSNPTVIRIIMLNVAQSVALDYFSKLADDLMLETTTYTHQLEKYGKINISTKRLKMFIGKVLNIKNRIADSFYILDSPEEAWEDEYLSKIDVGLRKTFDVKIRFLEIDYQLKIIRDNLDLFKDLAQHQKSNMLEWVIILLILVEVVNLFVEKFWF